MTTMCVGAMLAIIVDRTHESVGVLEKSIRRPRVAPAAVAVTSGGRRHVGRRPRRWCRSATAIAGNVPFTVESMAIPQWFADVAPHLQPGQVILPFPPAVAGGAAMTWQAIDSLDFAMPTGGGPESIPARAGPGDEPVWTCITESSLVLSNPAPATPANIAAVRAALAGWGVTMVVVPYPTGLDPAYNEGSGTAWALGMFTLAIGRKPQYRRRRMGMVRRADPGPDARESRFVDFVRCTNELSWRSGPLQAVPDCVTAPPVRA